MGTVVGFGLFPAVAGQTDNSEESTYDDETLSRKDFKVVGTKKTKTTFEPNTIVIETIFWSQDLKKRYGRTPPKITEKEVIDRSKIPDEEDEHPEHDVIVNEQRWESHFAKEEEWKQQF